MEPLNQTRKAWVSAIVAAANLVLLVLLLFDFLPKDFDMAKVLALVGTISLPIVVYFVPNEPTQQQVQAVAQDLLVPAPIPGGPHPSMKHPIHPDRGALGLCLAFLCMFLAGCATPTPEAARQASSLATCEAYSRTLTALAGYRKAGRLNDSDIRQVEAYRPLFRPCTSDVPPDLDGSALDAMEEALIQMVIIDQRSRAR